MRVCVGVFAESGFLLPRFHSQRVAKAQTTRKLCGLFSPTQTHSPSWPFAFTQIRDLHYLHRPTQTEVLRGTVL